MFRPADSEPAETLRVVREAMGTAVTMAFRSPVTDDLVDGAYARIEQIEASFSTFRPDSEISRISRGDLAESDASAEVQGVLQSCASLRVRTNGWFEFEPMDKDGRRLDPAGYVKGWAVEQAMDSLTASGIADVFISAGGDIVARSSSAPWRIGIQHPHDQTATAATLLISNEAVATSGLYERGAHIWGKTGSPIAGLLSVTVVGPELGIADAAATALFAAGDSLTPVLSRFPGYEALVITDNDEVRWTTGLSSKLASSAD